jgi:hypothetical protein
MKFNLVLLAAAAAGSVSASPKRRGFNMVGMLEEMAPHARRQAPNVTVEMIGDLRDGATTPVGNLIRNCLLGTGPCQDLSAKVLQVVAISAQSTN